MVTMGKSKVSCIWADQWAKRDHAPTLRTVDEKHFFFEDEISKTFVLGGGLTRDGGDSGQLAEAGCSYFGRGCQHAAVGDSCRSG